MKTFRRGFTLLEEIVALMMLVIMVAAIAYLMEHSFKATLSETTQGQAQETARQGLQKIELSLMHANEVQVASPTFVQFIVDIDQSPNYNPNAFTTDPSRCPGNTTIPNYRNGDRDCDAQLIISPTAQWQIGYNLQDDDEDGDGRIDVQKRVYLSTDTMTVWEDMSINEEAWGKRLKPLMTDVSTFTISYFGNPTNLRSNMNGTSADSDNDGIVDFNEMASYCPISGDGCDATTGALDHPDKLWQVTSFRIYVGVDKNHNGNTNYAVTTDVYPPLLPVKHLPSL